MHREPDCRLGHSGSRDTVALPWRDQDPISRPHDALAVFALENKRRFAPQQDDPLIPVLIEPFAFGCRVTCRDNALDAQAPGRNNRLEQFGRQRADRQALEDIAMISRDSCPT